MRSTPLPGGCSGGPAHVWYWGDCVTMPTMTVAACTIGAHVRIGALDGTAPVWACTPAGSTCPPGLDEDVTVVPAALRVVAVTGDSASDSGDVMLDVSRF